LGVDSVIITAGTSSLDPVNFAGRICRKRGSVIIVGAVPTGFERDPDYYRKELDLRMSCSYGPGRYDPNFEDKGIDYPAAYVRWTEKRNMQSFHKLIENENIDVAGLITHEFEFEKAAEAYELILGRTEPYFGVLLSYDIEKPSALSEVKDPPKAAAANNGVSFIGAGSYAQSFLLPNIGKIDSLNLRGAVTNSGTTSQRVADQYDFDYCSDDPSKVFADAETSTVFIATRHDTHASYVLDGLKAGKNVYVEKPLCLTTEELQDIADAYKGSDKHLMVGFNRRFAPHVQNVKGALGSTPMSVTYRVNAGNIPADSWIQDMEVGGGRIIGEGCHFIDLITFLTGSLPTRVYASSMRGASGTEDTVSINIEYENGSIGTVHYFANGAKSLSKEYIEIFQDGTSHVIDDFKVTSSYRSGGKPDVEKSAIQNKGQTEMVTQFINRVNEGGEPLIPFSEIYGVAAATLAAVASLRHHMPVQINELPDDKKAK
jgi:polar amino acid transport system substrate-binding protein